MSDPHGDACPCPDCAPANWMAPVVIDFAAFKAARDLPDAEFRTTDEFGRPMFTFLLEFTFDGSAVSASIWAYDLDDAEARVAAARETLMLVGQIHSEVEG